MSALAILLGALSSAACSASSTERCERLPGTPAEIAATPRADENLELLALRLSDGFTADEATYQRLTRDVAAIRALEPVVQNIRYFSPFHANALNVSFDDLTFAKVQMREYHAWDCLNDHFGATDFSNIPNTGVSVTFRGQLAIPKLIALYGKLPGVRFAEPVWRSGGGPTIYVTPGADAWHYVFADTADDCVAGCSESDAYYFVTDGEGKPAYLGNWHIAAPATEPPPPWMEQYLRTVKTRWRQQAKR